MYLELFFGIRVRVFGYPEKFADRSLIILNHRCHFDWMYFWLVLAQRGDVNKLSIMLKCAGKYLPFIGQHNYALSRIKIHYSRLGHAV